jgi:VWFA-related protein
MNKVLACCASLFLTLGALAQTPAPPKTTAPPDQDEEVLRITTELVQVDAVVMDKNDQPVTDLKMSDFDVYDNGKKQDLQFMEFVSVNSGRRTEGSLAGTGSSSASVSSRAAGVDTSVARDLSAKDVRRVIAFVVDDVTIDKDDLFRVRQMLTDFVDNKMQEGDLVAIVRTVGGKGLFDQFTTDKQLLRRAIAQLNPRSIPPYLALTSTDPSRVGSVTASPTGTTTSAISPSATETVSSSNSFDGPSEGTNQVPKAILALSVSNQIVNNLRQIPGRKNLVLVSGGLPLFDLSRNGSVIGDVSQIFRALSDNATRSGVTINTLDARGQTARGAVAKFSDTPGKSALGMTAVTPAGTADIAGGDQSPTFGRAADAGLLGENPLSEQLTLTSLAGTTGGVAVVNANNFGAGLDRVLERSRAYYRLAYRPSEKFDNKYHKIEIKVRRGGARVYTAEGYVAREDKPTVARTKEEEMVRAAGSPIARRDLDVSADLQYRFTPANNQAQLDINTLIDAHKLNFERTPEGKYHTSFDVVGFVFDQSGRSKGGISQTVVADLTEEDYRRALAAGLGYSASTQLAPGYYQVRMVVRETGTGNLGTVSRYFEVPDLSNKQLTMSSVMLYGLDAAASKTPVPLPPSRAISRKQELRYAAIIYNPKTGDGGKAQLRSRLIVSQGDRVLFEEPEQAVESKGGEAGQVVKIGQLGLSKVAPGRYVLTLVVTDPLADKKHQTVARSIDFTVTD